MRTKSIRAEKAISRQRVSQFTNCADIATTKKGISNDLIMQFWLSRIDKEVFCVACIESYPYQRIEWIVSRVCLVFLGLWLIDACCGLSYPYGSKEEKGDGVHLIKRLRA